MSSHHVASLRTPAAGLAAWLFLSCAWGAHAEGPAASVGIVGAASIATPAEVIAAPRAEPVEEVRSAIPVIRVPEMAEPLDITQNAGYAGHIVKRNETLESIALEAGCTPQMLMGYNRIVGTLQPGRELIVPLAPGHASTLANKPVIVERGLTSHPMVALTFDAGSTAEPLPKLLKTLREHQLKVTFFVTGFWVRENPQLLQQIVAEGHELGNHSLTHPDMRNLDDMRIKHEILETERLVRKTTGQTTRPYFRPPYGAYNDRVLQTVESLGYLPVYWTLDCLDSTGVKKTSAFIADRVTHKLPREQMCGSIVLMHVDSMATADAVPEILSRFDQMGLSVVTLSQVLNERLTVTVSKN